MVRSGTNLPQLIGNTTIQPLNTNVLPQVILVSGLQVQSNRMVQLWKCICLTNLPPSVPVLAVWHR